MRSPQIIVVLAIIATHLTAAKASSHKTQPASERSLLLPSLIDDVDKRNWGRSKTRTDWSRYRGGAEKVEADPPKTSANKNHGLFHREKKNKKKEDDNKRENEKDANSSNKYVFSICQPGDGSQEDPDNIPRTFMNMAKGNREVAKAALATTQQWRTENQVDTILQRPHPNFDVCKILSLHSFLGRDATGHVVFFQRPAVDADEHLALFTKNNMSNEDILLHYIYVFEYCWNILDPPNADNPEEEPRTMTSILDLTGLNMSILRHRDLIGFVKQFVQMTSTHYPARSYKTLLLNAPSWFGMLYKLLTPLLRESTRAKVSILSRGKQQTKVLREVLGDDCLQYLPADILETDRKKAAEQHNEPPPVPPMEQEIRDFCRDRLQDAGAEMNPLIT